jgi:hypothetical protein
MTTGLDNGCREDSGPAISYAGIRFRGMNLRIAAIVYYVSKYSIELWALSP